MSAKELSVKLDGLEISDKDMASLEREINSVVLKHIAATKQPGFTGSLTGSAAITIGKLNPQWRGIWLKTFNTKIDLEKGKFDPVQTLAGH